MMDDPEAGRAHRDARVSLRGLGRPDEVAEAIALLPSNGTSYVMGTTVPFDDSITAM